jgi:predicted acylesterase/phospholipase RssA/CRP-like cAMP-binding protein
MSDFARRLTPRWQRTQLVRILTDLFGNLDAAALHALQSELEWRRLAPGETLFRQGEAGDATYIVVNGRLRIVVPNPDGSRHIVDEAGRGETVGEFALLTGEPRTATVYAIRDTDVVRLAQPVFDRLIERYPHAMLHIARIIARRDRRLYRVGAVETPATSFVVVPITSDVPLTPFVRRLTAAMAAFGSTLHLNSEQFDRAYGKDGAAQIEADHPMDIAVVGWLTEQELQHSYVVYEADQVWSPWTQRCLRQADRIILIGQAGDDPGVGKIETALRSMNVAVAAELVLLHSNTDARPVGTRRWLEPRQVEQHHHVRLDVADDFRRLARRMTNRAIGLVLSGGGACAFVHVGVFRALEEAGLEIDLVGGTSMGALLGAAYLMDWDYGHLHALAQTLNAPKHVLDRTLPFVSLMASAKVTTLYRELFGNVQIEDLRRPFFCVSTNLTRAKPMIHRQGAVWEAVRASTALPGVFSPLLYNGDVLVDGGVMNNFPIDLMREQCGGGTVIAVDASPPLEKFTHYQFGPSISGWHVLLRRLNPFVPNLRVPSIYDILIRTMGINTVYRQPLTQHLADVLIQPPVGQFRPLDFTAYDTIAELGYQTAKEPIRALKAALDVPMPS